MEFAASLTKPIKPSQLYDTLMNVLGATPAGVQAAASREGPFERLAERVPLRILVAEDNVVNQQLALLVLQKLGYRAEVTANGLEALQALEREPYDVVLMDVQMPTMDGLEATHPPTMAREATAARHRGDRQRHAGGARGLSGRGDGRLPQQADPSGRAGRRAAPLPPHVAPQPRLRRTDPARALRCHQSRSRKGSLLSLGCSIRRRWSASWRPSEMTVVFSRRSSTRS